MNNQMDDKLKELFRVSRPELDELEPSSHNFHLIMSRLEKTKQKAKVYQLYRMTAMVGAAAIMGIIFYVVFSSPEEKGVKQTVVLGKPELNQENETSVVDLPSSQEIMPSDETTAKFQVKAKDKNSTTGNQFETIGSPAARISALYSLDNHVEVKKKVIEVLFRVLNNDPNTNVRMAALDVLAGMVKHPLIREKLLKSLPEQDDLIIQLELIQVVARFEKKEASDVLKQFVEAPGTDEKVREQARYIYTAYNN
jgi:hypothetical protein